MNKRSTPAVHVRLTDSRALRVLFATSLLVVISPAFSHGVSDGSWASALILGLFVVTSITLVRHIGEKKRQLDQLEAGRQLSQ